MNTDKVESVRTFEWADKWVPMAKYTAINDVPDKMIGIRVEFSRALEFQSEQPTNPGGDASTGISLMQVNRPDCFNGLIRTCFGK